MKKDRVMKRLIPQLGEATLQSRGDAFTTLARSIVGQQISVKAAQTVWDRFAALAPATMTVAAASNPGPPASPIWAGSRCCPVPSSNFAPTRRTRRCDPLAPTGGPCGLSTFPKPVAANVG